MTSSLRMVLLIGLALPGCAVPYQPARVHVPAPGVDAEQRIEEVFTRHFARLEQAARSPLRLRSVWLDGMDAGTPVQAQGYLRVEAESTGGWLVEVVVRRRALRESMVADPAWVDIGSDSRLEERIRAEIATALGLQG